MFLFDATNTTNDSIQTIAPSNNIEDEEITEYTYKNLAEYVEKVDYKDITLSGDGSVSNPFQVNSTEDFLWLMSGRSFDENKRGCLPEEYQEVSYLQSTGTQIIDTGVVVKNSIRPYIKFMASPVFNENGSVKNIFGGTDSNVPIAISCNYGDGDSKSIYAWHGNTYGNGNKTSSFYTAHGNVYELEYKERWWFNGVESTVTQQDAQGDSSNITIWFFGTNYCGDIRTFNIREYLNIYAFKLYDGEELIRDYVPCLRKSDNKPGMFDLVTNEFYTNQGEGEFNYGYGGKYKLENNAYIEINSDIYINDEIFDENGNPSGGDGVVCNWQIPIASLGNLNINGNENTIYNYFARTTDAATGDFSRHLFARSPGYVKLVKDLKLSGIYIYGGTATCVGAIGSQVYYIYNCSVLSGNVVAKKSYAGAFAGYMNIEAKYCNNYANVYSYYQNIGGLFGVTRGKISYCNNYGNLTIDESANNNGRIGGIVSQCNENGKNIIEYCNNYGNLTILGTYGGQSGGIAAWGRGIIRHCKNYGSVSGSAVVGGIVGL